MRYIKRVTLENFQSHKKTTLDFENNLNIIVGPSDSGKSAVFRALKWALYNEPAGDFFMREGENETRVTVVFNNGVVVERYRTKSKNGYLLKYSDGTELRFEGIGSGVPLEISEATGIVKIPLEKGLNSSINLSEQLEGPFLLSEKASTRANAIGQIVGVDIIDQALKTTLRDKNNSLSKLKHYENDKALVQEKIEKYSFLEDLALIRDSLDKIHKELYVLEDLFKELQSLKQSLESVQEEIKTNVEVLKKCRHIETVALIIAKAELLSQRKSILFELKEKQIALNTASSYETFIISRLNNTESIDGFIISLDQSTNRYTALKSLKKGLDLVKNENVKISIILESETLKYKANEIVNITQEKYKLFEQLSGYSEALKALKQKFNLAHTFIEERAQLPKINTSTDSINIFLSKLNVLEQLKKDLTKLNNLKSDTLKDLNEDKSTYQALVEQYKDTLLKAGRCPVCFSELDKHKIEDIITFI